MSMDDCKGVQEDFMGDGNVLYHDYGGSGYMTVNNYQNSLNCN